MKLADVRMFSRLDAGVVNRTRCVDDDNLRFQLRQLEIVDSDLIRNPPREQMPTVTFDVLERGNIRNETPIRI